MTYHERYLDKTHLEQSYHHNHNQNQNYKDHHNNLLENEIYSTATIWFSGGNRPTLYLPMDLAEKHGMNKPCRIAFYDDTNNRGILIKFLHDKNNNKNNNKE